MPSRRDAQWLLTTLLALLFSSSDLRAEKPEDVLKQYLEAPNWQSRLKVVLDPERLRESIKARYEGKLPLKGITISVLEPKKLDRPGAFHVTAVLRKGEAESRLSYYIVKKGEGYKVDWEASIGHNPTALKTFTAGMPEKAATFRVEVQVSSAYNGDYFGTQKTHYAFSLREMDPFERVRGYISKDSADGKKLFELLKDGKSHPVMVEIKYVGLDSKPPRFKDASVVTITKLVSPTWLK